MGTSEPCLSRWKAVEPLPVGPSRCETPEAPRGSELAVPERPGALAARAYPSLAPPSCPTQLGRSSVPTTLAYDCPTAGSMADRLLALSRGGDSRGRSKLVTRDSPCKLRDSCLGDAPDGSLPAPGRGHGVSDGGGGAARAAAGSGDRRPRRSRGGGDRGQRGREPDEDTGGFAKGAWEEEAHLDNAFYLLYK